MRITDTPITPCTIEELTIRSYPTGVHEILDGTGFCVFRIIPHSTFVSITGLYSNCHIKVRRCEMCETPLPQTFSYDNVCNACSDWINSDLEYL